MAHTAQTELLPAAEVARQTPVEQSENGIFYATFGDHKLQPAELAQILGAVPRAVAAALKHRAYYFVPLTIYEQEGDTVPDDAHSSGETLIAPAHTTELSDREREICARFAPALRDCKTRRPDVAAIIRDVIEAKRPGK